MRRSPVTWEELLARSERVGDCLVWTGSTDEGRGRLFGLFVHRVAYTLKVGRIPARCSVLRICDRRSCFEPLHLYTRTAQKALVVRWETLLVRSKRVGDCVVWLGRTSEKGYGKLGDVRVHRLAYELKVAAIPEGLMVLHDCDAPACFEPSHLYVGTAAQNSADMVRRGRTNKPKGARNGRSKLKPEDVFRIRELYRKLGRKHGEVTDLARELGVGPGTVRWVARRKTWRHLL